MTEDKLKTYKEGFRDGFDEGYKRGRADADLLNPYKLPHPAPMEDWTACKVCGKTGVNNMVCTYHSCPSRITYLSIKDLKITSIGNTYMSGTGY